MTDRVLVVLDCLLPLGKDGVAVPFPVKLKDLPPLPAVREAIRELKRAGSYVALMTDRPLPQVMHWLREHDLHPHAGETPEFPRGHGVDAVTPTCDTHPGVRWWVPEGWLWRPEPKKLGRPVGS